MYEYYNSILKQDDPIITSLDNIYQNILKEIIDLISKKEKEEEEKKNSILDFNSTEFENTIEDQNDFGISSINDDNDDLIKDRYCINISSNNDNSIKQKDRYNNLRNKNKEKNMSIKTEPNTNLDKNSNIKLTSSRGNIPKQIVNKPQIKLNKEKKVESKLNNKKTNNNKNINGYYEKDEKKGFTNIIIDLKKEKPVKLKNKNGKEPIKNEIQLKRLNALKKENISPEAEILSELTNIKVLFSFQPKKKDLEQTKKK